MLAHVAGTLTEKMIPRRAKRLLNSRGLKPSQLPVQASVKFELMVNLARAWCPALAARSRRCDRLPALVQWCMSSN